MYHCIVIGNPINHSKSPAIHTAFARSVGLDIRYQRQYCPDDADSFKAVVQAFFNGGGTGANITLPFKQMAYTLCDSLSPYATAAQAVNTLMMRDGKLYGDNTDGRGLIADLLDKGVDLTDKNIAILGAGGATRGVMLPLLEHNVGRITIFNRTQTRAHEISHAFMPFLKQTQSIDIKGLATENLTGFYDIIINATSAGATGQSLGLSKTDIHCNIAYDMMYGTDTEFMMHFNKSAQVYDGFGMLINQARLSFELWTGTTVDLAQVDTHNL